ncbi:MAG TPA: type ISP restriction/modification enzyme [Thermoanaerobaculia bacterium]|nr:type ISP restriction/modification enzyme [Thermoanaerobaculia bacterium]
MLGVSTNRDEWVVGFAPGEVAERMRFFVRNFERTRLDLAAENEVIKWSRNLKRRSTQGKIESFDPERIRSMAYRPFCRRVFYDSALFVDERGAAGAMFPVGTQNQCIVLTDPTAQKPWLVLVVDDPPDLHLVGAAAGAVCLPLKTYDGVRSLDNITDWAVDQFTSHYAAAGGKSDRPISKEAIFHYVYAVLHDPIYREKYALNLKRDFPRIPFYPAFWQWTDWGRRLMDLHLGYETVEPWPLVRRDVPDERARAVGQAPKAQLKTDKVSGTIVLDTETTLSGVPAEAWAYVLGNRSALEWILDQYKEKKPKDPTIREKFDTYRFADYKEKVIDLLGRVTRVSVETVGITRAMRAARR